MINGVLLDLSGVIYSGDRAITGAGSAVERLRESGLPMRFVTNTTRTPKHKLIQRLQGFGIDISDGELFTPAQAACDWLKQNKKSPHLLVHPALLVDFDGLPEYDAKALVVGDAGSYFTYESLNQAFRLLNEGSDFLALATNRVFKDSDGQLSLDAGSFVAALQYATRMEPIVLGKPSVDFFGAALSSMSCRSEDAVMIGDDAEMDVAGALSAGVGHGLLVRTGKYRPGIEEAVQPRPTEVLDDIAQAADWIIVNCS